MSVAPYDRHMYPNYLGHNPGNQGRNFSASVMIESPFAGKASSTGIVSKDRYLMISATTGKDPLETANATNDDKCLPAGTTTGTPVPCASLKLSLRPLGLRHRAGPGYGWARVRHPVSGTGSGTGMGSGSVRFGLRLG